MNGKFQGWVVVALLLGTAAYAIAQEQITLTTYYPSPRGVYDELRARLYEDFDDNGPPNNYQLDMNNTTRLNILNVTGVAEALTVEHDARVKGELIVGGNTQIDGTLTVTGLATLNGGLQVLGDVIADRFVDRGSPQFLLDPAAGVGTLSANLNGDVSWGGTLTGGSVPLARLTGNPLGCTPGDGGTAVKSIDPTTDGVTCGLPEAVYANPP